MENNMSDRNLAKHMAFTKKSTVSDNAEIPSVEEFERYLLEEDYLELYEMVNDKQSELDLDSVSNTTLNTLVSDLVHILETELEENLMDAFDESYDIPQTTVYTPKSIFQSNKKVLH